MVAHRFRLLLLGAALSLVAGTGAAIADEEGISEASHPDAIELVNKTLQAMGGPAAWEKARVLKWRFKGKRLDYWDKQTGDVRIEAESTVILMNLDSKKGRAWKSGVEVTDSDSLKSVLDDGYAAWINDSYWLVMPYKLLDHGVRLSEPHDAKLPDGRTAQRIVVTFDEVGLTPENKYDVYIADDTGLVEQWAYYEKSTDPDPKFTLPWGGWKKFGPILLATEHGSPGDWEIQVFEQRPPKVFESP